MAADRLGDPTPRLAGRLTANPVRHLDVMGTLVLVATFASQAGLFFGWAKPIPVDQRHFADPQRGMLLVGLAGPLANVALAASAAGLVWVTVEVSLLLAQAFALVFLLNVLLALINLVPIPPLDGSRVLGGFLPRRWYAAWLSLDRYGTWVLLGLLVLLIARPGFFQATLGRALDLAFAAFLPT